MLHASSSESWVVDTRIRRARFFFLRIIGFGLVAFALRALILSGFAETSEEATSGALLEGWSSLVLILLLLASVDPVLSAALALL